MPTTADTACGLRLPLRFHDDDGVGPRHRRDHPRVRGYGGVGTVYRNRSTFAGRTSELTYTVIERDEPRRDPRASRLERRPSPSIDTITVPHRASESPTVVRYEADFTFPRGSRSSPAPFLGRAFETKAARRRGARPTRGARACSEGIGSRPACTRSSARPELTAIPGRDPARLGEAVRRRQPRRAPTMATACTARADLDVLRAMNAPSWPMGGRPPRRATRIARDGGADRSLP